MQALMAKTSPFVRVKNVAGTGRDAGGTAITLTDDEARALDVANNEVILAEARAEAALKSEQARVAHARVVVVEMMQTLGRKYKFNSNARWSLNGNRLTETPHHPPAN